MFELHERWLQRLDGVEYLLLQHIIIDDIQCFLKHIVTKLVIDELLHNKMDPSLEVLGLLGLVAKLLDNLLVVIWEFSFEYLVNVGL